MVLRLRRTFSISLGPEREDGFEDNTKFLTQDVEIDVAPEMGNCEDPNGKEATA